MLYCPITAYQLLLVNATSNALEKFHVAHESQRPYHHGNNEKWLTSNS